MYKLLCSNARMDLVYFHFRKAWEKNGGGAYLRMKCQLHVPLVTLSYSLSFSSNMQNPKIGKLSCLLSLISYKLQNNFGTGFPQSDVTFLKKLTNVFLGFFSNYLFLRLFIYNKSLLDLKQAFIKVNINDIILFDVNYKLCIFFKLGYKTMFKLCILHISQKYQLYINMYYAKAFVQVRLKGSYGVWKFLL